MSFVAVHQMWVHTLFLFCCLDMTWSCLKLLVWYVWVTDAVIQITLRRHYYRAPGNHWSAQRSLHGSCWLREPKRDATVAFKNFTTRFSWGVVRHHKKFPLSRGKSQLSDVDDDQKVGFAFCLQRIEAWNLSNLSSNVPAFHFGCSAIFSLTWCRIQLS